MGAEADGISFEAFKPRSGYGAPQTPLFARLGPEQTRLDFSHQIATWHDQKRLYLSSFAGGGLALGDIDGDSLTDLFVAGGADDNRLYLQGEDLTFLDITAGLSIEGAGRWSPSAVILDIDNDGDNDLYVCHYDQPNELFLNQLKETGKLAFKEDAARFQLSIADASLMPAFADYDLDGDLDLYLLTHRLHRDGGRPATAIQVQQNAKGGSLAVSGDLARYYAVADRPDASGKWTYWEHGRPDRLLRNDKGVFHDVTAVAGISTAPATGNSAIWWDFDEDGWPDLFVGNEDAPSLLYRNSGKGTFVEVSQTHLPPGPQVARGCTTLDADHDGRPDLLVATVSGQSHYQRYSTGTSGESAHNALYLATGTGGFLEAGWMSGLGRTGHTWSVQSGDYDLDGWEDVFFTNGAARHSLHGDLPKLGHEQLVGRTLWDHNETAAPELRQANLAYRGSPTLPWPDVSSQWGLDLVGMSYSCAQADLDNDGDLDLAVCGLNDPIFVFRNDSAGHHSARIRLTGGKSHRAGIGARVVATTPLGRQVREIRSTHGYLASGDGSVHFGLGPHERIALLQVHWPSGATQEFKDLPADRLYTIAEPASRKAAPSRGAVPLPLFASQDALAERADGRAIPGDPEQPVYQLARLGPGQAWGDVDSDGKPDLYLGGGAGQPGRLLFNRASPTGKLSFTLSAQRLFDTHSEREDTCALFFDADGDGHLDLYIGSGATGQEEGASTLRDRLYMNEGSGVFDDESFRLPDIRENTSTACAADFDRDGDLDLFTGFLGQPGRYPLFAGGRLLANEASKEFRDVTKAKAPHLASAGLITSSLWADCDGDSWPELIVAQDRGPILIYPNREGTLSAPMKASSSGRWNAVAAADLDQDGDMDLVATNWGINLPNPATPQSSDVLFSGEGLGDGKLTLVEAYRENKIWYPRGGLRLWRQSLPALFPETMTYHQFANGSLGELFGIDRLRKANILKVTESRSGYFENDAKGRFSFAPFPQIAQIAPAFGIALSDFDLDGRIDCYLAQNNSALPAAFGPLAGGAGQLLRNTPSPKRPEDRFVAVPAAESGVYLRGDGRSAAAVDLNSDGRPDLVTARNGSAPSVLVSQVKPAHSPLAVQLSGPPGNLLGIGAQVILRTSGLPQQTREIRAGEGLRSSVVTAVLFALPKGGGAPPELQVNWPDGTISRHPIPDSGGRVEIAYPPPAPVVAEETQPGN